MRHVYQRIRSITSLTVILALCFTIAVAAPAYAGNVTVKDALDTPLTIYNYNWDGWLSAEAHDGVDMAQSPDIGSGQNAWFYIKVVGPGTLSWWAKTSSEFNFDTLQLWDNDLEQTDYRQSGVTDWAQWSYVLGAGEHTIKWVYQKDETVNVGEDCAYLDGLVWTSAPPVGRVDGARLARNEVQLLHGTPAAGDQFGGAVAISSNVLAVGAPFDDTGFADAGSVSIFRRTNGSWARSQTLTAGDEAANRYFGLRLALQGDRLAVGTSERVYVYKDTAGTFLPLGAPITCPDGGGTGFGQSFDIDGNMLVVGARAANAERGRVYFFQYSSGTWNYIQWIDAPDAALANFFGTSVALEDDRLVVGAPEHDHPGAPGGAVYVFDIDSGTFSFTQEMTDPGAIAEDRVGCSVGISGNTIVAGSNNSSVSGAVPRVLVFNGGVLTDVLTRDVAQPQCWYGLRVAIDGDTILVPDEFYDGFPQGGTVFAYQRSNGEFFDLVEKIHMAGNEAYAGFGRSVAIEGSQFAVGAGVWDGPAGNTQGSAYVYDGSYYRVMAGSTFGVPANKGLCANDIEPNGDPVTVYTFVPPSSGTINYVAPDGSFSYTAAEPSPAEVAWGYTPRDPFGSLGVVTDAYITVAPRPGGTPVVNGGSHNSNVRDIPVDLSAVANVRMYRTKIDSGAWSDWKLKPTGMATVQLPVAAGTYTINVEVKGSGGSASHAWAVAYPATFTRFEGADRYATAIKVSQGMCPTGSCDAVIIATGTNYPDALAAAGLGSATGGPVLLVSGTKVRADVLAEIKRLTKGRSRFTVYIMGGTVAVPASIENSIKSGLTGETVVRFAGTDRYHTARLVAVRMKALLGGAFGTKALLVPGQDYTDGLIVGPAAYSAKAPILLCRPTADAQLAATLKQLGISEVVLCGKAAALPASVGTYLKSAVPGLSVAQPTSSADAYVRSAEAAEYFTDPAHGFGLSWSGVGIATAERYPDGLAAGCAEGRMKTPLLLTRVASLPATIGARLSAHKATITAARLYGGPLAVSPATETAVRNALK